MSPDDPLRLAISRTKSLASLLKQIDLRRRGGVEPSRHHIEEATALADKIHEHIRQIKCQRFPPTMLTAAELAAQNDGST